MWLVAAAVLCIVIWLGYEYYEHEAVQITEHTIPANGLMADRALCFCVISDLHNNKKHCEDKLLAKLKNCKPDAFLLCGDMVNKHKADNTAALHFIKKLTAIAPVFYSYGNHEMELKADKSEAWEQYISRLPAGCILLDNQAAELKNLAKNLLVCGLTLPECFYGKGALLTNEAWNYLPRLSLPSPSICTPYYRILLAHHPEYDVLYKKYKPDLILSGHLHGGLVRLPLIGGLISPRYRFPKKDSGFYKSSSGTLFISRGLGSHTIPLRAFNRTELTMITLLPKNCLEKRGNLHGNSSKTRGV